MVGALQMESRLAEQAVSDLPGVFSEVFSMQRLQSDEIGRQRAFFDAMKIYIIQSKIAEVESRNADLEFDVACARNKIFMKEEWIKDTTKIVKQLDEEIRKLVEEKAQQQMNMTIADELSDSEIRRLRDRCEQMEEYARHVEEFEKTTSGDHKELQEVKKTIKELRAQKTCLEKDPEEMKLVVSSVVAMELRAETETLKHQLRDTGTETNHFLQNISEEKHKQKQAAQTMKVLEKRNCAQLTRLRKQVAEVRQKNVQREAQNQKLRDNIENARRKLAP